MALTDRTMSGRRYIAEDGTMRMVMGPSETKKGEMVSCERVFERVTN